MHRRQDIFTVQITPSTLTVTMTGIIMMKMGRDDDDEKLKQRAAAKLN